MGLEAGWLASNSSRPGGGVVPTSQLRLWIAGSGLRTLETALDIGAGTRRWLAISQLGCSSPQMTIDVNCPTSPTYPYTLNAHSPGPQDGHRTHVDRFRQGTRNLDGSNDHSRAPVYISCTASSTFALRGFDVTSQLVPWQYIMLDDDDDVGDSKAAPLDSSQDLPQTSPITKSQVPKSHPIARHDL